MRIETLKKALPYTPEILLLTGGMVFFLAELITTSAVNTVIGLGILAVLTLLLWKNKVFALFFAILLGTFSAYFLLALLSEFHEFPSGSQEGLRMLLIGSLIAGSLLAISITLPKKYFNRR